MRKENEELHWSSFLLGILAGIAIIIIVFTFSPKQEFEISSLPEDTCYQFCTASINSKAFLCEEYFELVELYNATSKEVQELIQECPDGRIIDNQYCVGERLTICRED